jgi:hypothetical protein
VNAFRAASTPFTRRMCLPQADQAGLGLYSVGLNCPT